MDWCKINYTVNVPCEMELKNKDIKKSLIKNWLSIPLSLKKNIYVIYFESEDQTILKRLKYRNGDSILERQENFELSLS